MKTAVKFLMVVCAVALLVWGGLALNHSLACKRLENDYLNSVASLKGNALLLAAIGDDPKTMTELKRISDDELKSIQTTLTRIYEECGDRAGQTAARKGTEILF